MSEQAEMAAARAPAADASGGPVAGAELVRGQKTVADSRVEISRLMRPHDTNFAGNVHGGVLLGLMDEVAFLCASKYAQGYCVTVGVDRVEFHSPVRVGDLVTLRAAVNLTGRSSMEVGISIVAERPDRQDSDRRTNRCFFTMVAIDDEGGPTPVPELLCETSEDLTWQCEAKLRKELRVAYGAQLQAGICVTAGPSE